VFLNSDSFVFIQSCGWGVPVYTYVRQRNTISQVFSSLEGPATAPSTATINQVESSAPQGQEEETKFTIRDFWKKFNLQSLDGLPGLLKAHKTEGEVKNDYAGPRPKNVEEAVEEGDVHEELKKNPESEDTAGRAVPTNGSAGSGSGGGAILGLDPKIVSTFFWGMIVAIVAQRCLKEGMGIEL
jgi:hypothetical protein